MPISKSEAIASLLSEVEWTLRDDDLEIHTEGVATPSDAEIDVEIARLEVRRPILDEIYRLENLVTQMRICEAFDDPTWINAQRALITAEKAKL